MNPISKLTRWYFSKKALPYWCVLGMDCTIVLFSNFLVFTLNTGFVSRQQYGHLLLTLIVYLFCYIIGFRQFHTYSGVIRYSSFIDLQRVGFATLMGVVLIGILRIIYTNGVLIEVRLRDILLSAILSVSLMWAIRVLVKYLYDSTYQQGHAKHIFIYGVRQGGISLAKSIHNQDSSRYILSGFVSDEMDIQHKMLMGVQVYANDENLTKVMKKKQADILFVSPLKNEDLRTNKEMVTVLSRTAYGFF